MTAETVPAAATPPLRGAPAALWPVFRPVLPALLLGILVLGLLFHTEAAAAVQTWIDSTAYSHCFFVIPIAVYLAMDRRPLLVGLSVRPMPAVALAAIPVAIAWLGAERLGIMEGRQLVAMGLLELLFLAVLGRRMFAALSAPLLYLFFLVPFGAFVTPALQGFTAHFIDAGLSVLGIPHVVDAYFIEIPEGRFVVAEACAGLRFLIASIAFGVLYACLMYRGIWRRLGFIAASMVVPVIANGFRALGIVVIGHLIGSAQAAVTDHILYGWLFFSIVTVLLILGGLPFQQDTGHAPDTERVAPAPVIAARLPLRAAVMLSVLGALGPAASAALDRNAGVALAMPAPHFTPGTGCQALPGTGGPGIAVNQFACPAGRLTVTTQVFAPRANPAVMLAAQRRLSGESDGDEPEISNLKIPGVIPPDWRFVVMSAPARATASALWVDGAPARGGWPAGSPLRATASRAPLSRRSSSRSACLPPRRN
jgi:exosortase A